MSDARIALFFDGFDQGGIGRVNLTLAATLLHAGLGVDLLVLRANGPRRDEVPAGARVIDFAGAGMLSLMAALRGYVKATPQLQGMIVSNVLLAPHVGLAVRSAGRLRLPILCVHHVDMRRSMGRSGGIRISIRRALTVAVSTLLAVRLAAVSDGARCGVAESLRISPARVAVISNPVQLTAPGDTIPKETLAWWQAEGATSLLGIGRLTSEKDFESLIAAVDLLRDRAEVRLLIVGYGPHGAALDRLVEQRGLSDYVRLAGFVPQPRRYYEEADVFVLPSLSEAMPLSLIEAMSVGTQVVSTDCDYGPREILQDGRFGRLVPLRDPVALAEQLLSAIKAPVGAAALVMRAEEFSPHKVLERYLGELGLQQLMPVKANEADKHGA